MAGPAQRGQWARVWWALACVALIGSFPGGCRPATAPVMPDFPAGDVPNREGLVSVGWLRRSLAAEANAADRGELLVPGEPALERLGRLVVLEANWTAPGETSEYLAGHIPGAIDFNTESIEDGYPTWRLRSVAELQATIGRAGVSRHSTVVVYGRKLITAARVWWVLKYAGVEDVRLLDGGWQAWRAAGYPVETATREAAAVEFRATAREEWLATTEYVHERLEDGGAWLADVRSEAEYAGRTSGYDYLDARGRIPGAIAAGDADDAAGLYVASDGRLRPQGEVVALWREQGIRLDASGRQFEREVIFYCGGGWRSSVAFYYAWLLGSENARNYCDGWGGWSTRYVPDAAARGSTPGWRQQPTGNPVTSKQ